jgi:hypothetical protein
LQFPAHFKIPQMAVLLSPFTFKKDSTFDLDQDPLISC